MNVLIKFLVPLVFATTEYHANQSGNIVTLATPYGTQVLIGEPGFDTLDSYQFEIPLKDFIKKNASNKSDSSLDPKLIDNIDHLLELAKQAFRQNQYKRSWIYVNEALLRDGNNIRGLVMKGSLLFLQGKKDLAKQNWAQAQRLDPGNEQLKKILERYND